MSFPLFRPIRRIAKHLSNNIVLKINYDSRPVTITRIVPHNHLLKKKRVPSGPFSPDTIRNPSQEDPVI